MSRKENPGPVELRRSANGGRLVIEPFPVPPVACVVMAVLGAGLLMWIPWSLLGWRVPVGAWELSVPREAVSLVVVASLLAGGAMLSLGLAGLWAAVSSATMTFDRTTGQYWPGWRNRPTRHAKSLADIRTIRLDRHGIRSRLIIETDHHALPLASDEQAEAVALPGRQLAEFLKLPLAGL